MALKKLTTLCSPLLIVAAILALFVCCTPQWLPDSSGFVVVTSRGVVWYDLKTKKSKRIAKPAFPISSVGVMPTGGRVAVSQSRFVDKRYEIQLAMYNLKGESLHTSPTFRIEGPGSEGHFGSQTYVAKDEKRVLTFLPQLKILVIYQIDARKFRKISNVVPLTQMWRDRGLFFDISPLLPNGKGFIAASNSESGKAGLSLYSWGEEAPQKFEFDDNAKGLTRGNEPNNEFTVATDFTWQMGQLISHVGKGIVTIDPTARRVTYREDKSTKERFEFARNNRLHIVSEFESGALLQINESLEFQISRRNNGGPTSTIFQADKKDMVFVIPSPDRDRLLIRTMGDQHDRFRVIDVKTGKIVSEFKESVEPK